MDQPPREFVIRRWLIALVAFGLVAVAVAYMRNRPLDVHVSDILRLEIQPYPEGPPGPVFTREGGPGNGEGQLLFGLDRVERYIPDPLPQAPLAGFHL